MNLLPILVVLAQVESTYNEEPPQQEPPAPVAAPPEDHPVAPQPARPKAPVSVRVDGGWAPRKLFTIPVTGADFGFGTVAQPVEHAAFGGSLRGFVGHTENGLRVWDVRALGEAEVIALERLHLGAGVGVFILGVARAARDETIRSWGPEGQLTARFDVVRDDNYAIFVRGALSGGYDVYDSSAFWGPSIGAGFELDVAGTRKR
jgi:hypothetical protein